MSGLMGGTVVADDVIIYKSGFTYDQAVRDHNPKLGKLLTLAKRINLKLNKEVCKFLIEDFSYIEHHKKSVSKQTLLIMHL